MAPDERSQLTPANPFAALSSERDLLAELLADKRSSNTRREYAKDLKHFFTTLVGQEPNPTLVRQFLQLDRFEAMALVLKYKAGLIDRGLKEATVNRRLAAVKSLVNYARRVGFCSWHLSDIKSERVKAYRDTSGISPAAFAKMLAVPDRETLKGKRDYALLRLLWTNALRRQEVSQCNVSDLDLEAKKLSILGKGRGTQKEIVDLQTKTCVALREWLEERGELGIEQPLFISFHPYYGHRLTGDGIRKIVAGIAEAAGIPKAMSPHRIRHSSITAALDASGGDVRNVQKLSRHADLNTLMIYEDHRTGAQGRISELLEDLV